MNLETEPQLVVTQNNELQIPSNGLLRLTCLQEHIRLIQLLRLQSRTPLLENSFCLDIILVIQRKYIYK